MEEDKGQDEEGMEIEDEEAGFEMNKRIAYFVVDGSPEMLGDAEEGCVFRRALKAVFAQILRVGCTAKLSQMIGLIIANTASPNPSSTLVENFYELLDLDFASQDSAMTVKKLIDEKDLEKAFKKRFGGHGSCDVGSLLYYARSSARKKGRSNRELVVYYMTNKENPFGKERENSSHFKTALRHVEDLRRAGGNFNLIFLGQEGDDLTLWKRLDPTATYNTVANFESESVIHELVVMEKRNKGMCYGASEFNFSFSQRNLCKVISLNAPMSHHELPYALAAETKKPPPMYFDADTEARVAVETTWVPERNKEAQFDEGTCSVKVKEEGTSGAQKKQQHEHKARSELKQAIKLGGENILFTQEEIATLKRFEKGITLLGFKPISELRVDRHVEPAKFLYPSETTISGSRTLFRALLKRMRERKIIMMASLVSANNSRPRLVALVPEINREHETTNDGLFAVTLALADDIINDDAIEKVDACSRIKPEENKAACNLVRRLMASYSPYENPHLQSFYSMLVEYATGEAPKKVADTIVPYFKEEASLKRVQPQVEAFIEAFHLENCDRKEAKKRTTDGDRDDKAKRQKDEPVDLKQMAISGQLSKLTLIVLKREAQAENIQFNARVKKDELIKLITDAYSS